MRQRRRPFWREKKLRISVSVESKSVAVAGGEEPLELSALQFAFPGAIGLAVRCAPDAEAICLRADEKFIYPPEEGWPAHAEYIAKIGEHNDETASAGTRCCSALLAPRQVLQFWNAFLHAGDRAIDVGTSSGGGSNAAFPPLDAYEKATQRLENSVRLIHKLMKADATGAIDDNDEAVAATAIIEATTRSNNKINTSAANVDVVVDEENKSASPRASAPTTPTTQIPLHSSQQRQLSNSENEGRRSYLFSIY